MNENIEEMPKYWKCQTRFVKSIKRALHAASDLSLNPERKRREPNITSQISNQILAKEQHGTGPHWYHEVLQSDNSNWQNKSTNVTRSSSIFFPRHHQDDAVRYWQHTYLAHWWPRIKCVGHAKTKASLSFIGIRKVRSLEHCVGQWCNLPLVGLDGLFHGVFFGAPGNLREGLRLGPMCPDLWWERHCHGDP